MRVARRHRPTRRAWFLGWASLTLSLAGIGQMADLHAATPAELEEIETRLKTAEVLDMQDLPVGVTNPRVATLRHGEETFRAVWKVVDTFEPGKDFRDGGFPELGFKDSYKNEIAAYELDKLLGLGLVPVTVPRRIRNQNGSLQLFLEDAMEEFERMERGLSAPDTTRWNRQIYTMRLWLQLIDDSDFNNVRNLMVDSDFRLYCIDNSRSFRMGKGLQAEDDLTHFSRSLLDRIAALDRDLLIAELSPWATKRQVNALLKRRDRILALAKERIADRGEEAVLYP